jgi:drug/metabolite transporter (DMT)-like permease
METLKLRKWLTDPSLMLIFLAVFMKAGTSFFFKTAALSLEDYSFFNIVTNLFYWVSFIFFFFRALIWQFVLHKYPLSFAYPFNSLTLLILLFLGHYVFQETVEWNHIAGTVLISLGIVLLSKEEND